MPEQIYGDQIINQESISDDYEPILQELEEKNKSLCTDLEERIIIITAALKKLKQHVLEEKKLWKNEVKETIELEKKLSEHNRQNHQQGIEYDNQLQMLTTAFINSQTHIQDKINNTVYKQQLIEAENMCNLEMLKIRNSLECLAPLQAIVDEWNSGLPPANDNDSSNI